ncbi:DUF4833 domain-containing protein [Mucilaginibacter terrenus]|uniref:DUF4833 domain-containing protein n=1 Tax=Mucilaginibacter terrenus TaxID=2482727 RepID=A0A3E2NVN2_9SPHI|nr:DUF4833 domain-containing protein [Mucilaginibacter terrenus]RFZ85019.1 DUF4833 domain-containing protein [Mucilaginibacter terrenus]
MIWYKSLRLPLLLVGLVICATRTQATSITDPDSRLRLNNAYEGEKPIVFPTPPADLSRLFYVQRMPNINTLIYELNIDKETGKPNEDAPVHPYWIRYADKGQKEELNYVQRKFAYGLVQKKTGEDKYDIRFVSYKKFPLTLMKGADGKYHIFATVAQKLMALSYIFIKIEGGSFWLPNIVYVEMRGNDPVTGKEITERFKP